MLNSLYFRLKTRNHPSKNPKTRDRTRKPRHKKPESRDGKPDKLRSGKNPDIFLKKLLKTIDIGDII